MADYYPLLARALAGLPTRSLPAARRAIYDRARKALIGQLKSMQPALPDEDIAREDVALDAAIARLESEYGASGAAPAAGPPRPPVSPSPPAPAQPAGAPASFSPPPRPATTAAPSPGAPASFSPPPRPPTVAAPSPSPGAPARPPVPPPRYLAPRPPLPMRPPVPGSVEGQAPPLRAAPSLEEDGSAPPVSRGSTVAATDFPAPPLVKPYEPSGRPVAPGPAPARRRSLWPWLGLALVVSVVVVAAGFAFFWKEKPQELAIKGSRPAAAASASAGQNKIDERVGGGASPVATPQAAPVAAASTPSAPAPVSASGAASSAAPASAPAATPAAPAAPGAETPIPTVSVPTVVVHPAESAQNAATPAADGPARAALLIEQPSDPQKPKIELGDAVWSLLPAATGAAGKAAGPAVQAQIDIPDMKMHATVTIRKNTDASLPATHTIDLRVTFADGAPVKGLKDMGMPQLRRNDTPSGEPVSGVRVKINDSYFLVGLTRSDVDTAHNLELLGERNWIDFPLLLDDDQVAKLTFEKGAAGKAIMEQALAAWK